MTDLYIFGNGFDRANSLQTDYSQFRDWLCKEDKTFLDKFEDGMRTAANYGRSESNEFLDTDDMDDWIWSNLEMSLGVIPEYFLDKSDVADQDLSNSYDGLANDVEPGYKPSREELEDISFDPAVHDTVLANEDDGINWKDIISEFYSFLSTWVQQIDDDLPKQVKKPRNMVSRLSVKDRFLTFNYTSTLEKAYGLPCSRILHIHGRVGSEKNPIILGHGENIRDFSQDTFGYQIADDLLGFAADNTYKDVCSIIGDHYSWFCSLKEISSVVIFGHSLSSVDLPYFKQIALSANNAVWTIYVKDLDSSVEANAKKNMADVDRLLLNHITYKDSNEF
ncbi:MAG: bacteriophage abortive infection AbiH family protein [Bifidobacterium crudilactis]|nr:bacteriophage abortive infection AbiH family protein [Bifidobacterium crudilactis]